MSDLATQALFLVYNKPLRIFINHLFDGNSPIRIEDLSEEQMPIFDLPLNRNYIIKGGPGTGKTLMAYFRAKKITKNVVVKTWHRWLWEKITGLNKDITDYQFKPYNFKWDLVVNLFENEVYPNIDKNCHLFLDEAQDFPKELAGILSKCFENVTIFIDEHQAIDRKTKPHEIRQIFDVESNPFPLSKNYRNSPEIFKVALLFFTGGRELLPEVCHIKSTGLKPRINADYSFQDTVDFLANYNRNHPQRMVGVVLPNPNKREEYFRALCAKRPKVSVQEYNREDRDNHFTLNDPGLKLLTINTVKGLEFDTVVICDIDNPFYKNLLAVKDKDILFFNKIYVACSRAKTELIFICKNIKENTFILGKLIENEILVKINFKETDLESDDVPF